jgi:hypothetical protein
VRSTETSAEILREPVNSPQPTSELPATTDVVPLDAQRTVRSKTIRRDINERLRCFDEQGNEYQDPELKRQQREMFEATDPEDLTQKSAMSLTQENPPSAYAQFDIQKAIRDDYPSTATPDDGDVRAPSKNQNEASLPSRRTESTAHTYEENDSRYINLDFEPSSVAADADAEDEDEDGGISQDPSFAAPPFEQPQSYEPQTPAPPMNPFNKKGSVMKASQLFGATQPSSVGRRVSPTSSRPSPDVYNNFSSPPKRSRLHSSPLAARNEFEDDTSPLQSSVRYILAGSNSALTELPSILRTSGVQSFDAGPRIQPSGAIHEPRPYLSMKESQERRKVLQSDTDSDSDSSIDARPMKRLERERRIRQELSTVGRMPISSRPSSASAVEVPSTSRRKGWQEQCEGTARAMRNTQDDAESSRPGSATVEVPSTGRRRSVQEEYIAQCEGRDARDTQHDTQDTQEEDIKDTPRDDIVADSQAVPNQEEELPEGHPSSNGVSDSDGLAEDQPGPSAIISQVQLAHHDLAVPNFPSDTHTDQQTEQHNEQEATHAPAATTSAPEPSLPLQELSMNQNNLRTPMANKNQPFSDGPDTVPETSPPERNLMEQRSPPEERLRPMGEIASISFGADGIADMSNIPGFTQDVDFENAMRMRSSPQPPLRLTARSAPSVQVSEAVAVNSNPAAAVGVANAPVDPPPADNPQQAAATVEETGNPEMPTPFGQGDEEVAIEQQNQHDDNQTLVDDAGKSNGTEDLHDTPENDPAPLSTKRTGLRTKNELKGPSRAFRRSGSTSRSNTPASGVSKRAPKAKAKATGSRSNKHTSTALIHTAVVDTPDPLPAVDSAESTNAPSAASASVPASTRSSKRKSMIADIESTPAPLPKRTSKRKSSPTSVNGSVGPTRSSKRQSIARDAKEASEDPLVLPAPATIARMSPSGSLFGNMVFAVSYSKREQEKNEVTKVIVDHGGQILQEGFDTLFDISRLKESEAGLTLSSAAKPLGFSALVADEHSRKAKYMQALALGLPCISGQWILACASKGAILDWSPYLLCAGQSSFLSNAMKSRVLQPYPAAEATLQTTLEARDKLLDGKSVLMVTGRGKAEKRKPYVFLTRALGPARVGQVGDLSEARTKLSSESWDLLYSDCPQEAAAATVFGSAASSGASKKRKRGPTTVDDSTPSPKRIRVIDDETMIQSLILGQFMEG